MTSKTPTRESIAATLQSAMPVWDAIIESLQAEYGPLSIEWKASKSPFGWMGVLKQKKRTLLYLTPEDGAVRIGIVLGERAARQALASELPDAIKTLIADARPYAEGRGIRFAIRGIAELPIVASLVAMKM